MAKRTKKKQHAISVSDVDRYKWEFLRRSKKYKRDYSKKYNHLDYWYKKYGVTFPFDPALSTDKYLALPKSRGDRVYFENSAFGPSVLLSNVRQAPINNRDILREDMLHSDKLVSMHDKDLSKISTLHVTVNLTRKEETILREFNELIAHWKRHWKRTTSKAHCGAYDDYLKAYDLREKGWSWRRIAKEMFPGEVNSHDFKAAIANPLRKVKRYYQKCKTLIDGGYDQIR